MKLEKKQAVFMFKVFVSISLLAFLFRDIQWEAMRQAFQSIRWLWFLGGLGAIWGLFMLQTLRWQYMLKAEGSEVTYRDVFDSNMIGYFFGHFLPTIVGGDMIRAYYVARLGVSKTRSMTIILLCRIVGIIAMLILAGICLGLSQELMKKFGVSRTTAVFGCAMMTGGIVAGLALVSSNSWFRYFQGKSEFLIRILETIRIYRSKMSVLGTAMGLSLVIQFLVVVRYFFVSKALGMDLGFPTIAVVSLLVILLTMLPISVHGIGIRESGFVYLLGLVGVPLEAAFTFSLLNYSVMLLMAFAGGIIYVKSGGSLKTTTTGEHGTLPEHAEVEKVGHSL